MKLEQIKMRWSAESPDFFKKITSTALTIFVIASGIEGILISFPIVIPPVVHTILIGVASMTLGIAKISRLTVDAEKLTEEQKNKLLN